MPEILIINTGGTFNKVYNPLTGTLDIQHTSLKKISQKWLCHLEIIDIIDKDSLDFTDQDRKILLTTIQQAKQKHIIIIHGTDTIDISAHYIAGYKINKSIIFTGAMVPYSIDPVEATANLASAYGYSMAQKENGVYIAMHGRIDSYTKVKKDRQKGLFI